MRTFVLAAAIFMLGAAPPRPPARRPLATTSSFTVYPKHCNHMGTLAGGTQLTVMDQVAGVVTRRMMRATGQEGRLAVTVAVERAEFKRPGQVGDIVHVTGRIVDLGETSVTIHVQLDTDDDRTLSWGRFVFVVIDAKTKKPVKHGLE